MDVRILSLTRPTKSRLVWLAIEIYYSTAFTIICMCNASSVHSHLPRIVSSEYSFPIIADNANQWLTISLNSDAIVLPTCQGSRYVKVRMYGNFLNQSNSKFMKQFFV